MTRRSLLAFGVLLTQQGCMMGMMGGMGGSMPSEHAGGASARTPARGNVIIRTAQDDFELSADFPVFAPQDSVEYHVTLRKRDGSPVTGETSVIMSSTLANASDTHRAGPAAALWPATRQPDGMFVFRPSLARGASYRLVVSVPRFDGRAVEPPVTITHVVGLDASTAQASAARHDGAGIQLTPLLLVGTGLMALMMLIVTR